MWGRCNATIMVMDEGEDAGGRLRPKGRFFVCTGTCETNYHEDPPRNDNTPTCAALPAVRGSDESLKDGEKPAVDGGSDAAPLGNAAARRGPRHSWITLIAQGGYQSCRRERREENKAKATAIHRWA